MLTVSRNFSSSCILQKCYFCQNESFKSKHRLSVFPKNAFVVLATASFSPFVPTSHRSRPEKGGWGEGRLMLAAAPSPWLRLGLPRCYYTLADRRESKSAVSDTGGTTFSAIDLRTMAAIYIGLNYPV